MGSGPAHAVGPVAESEHKRAILRHRPSQEDIHVQNYGTVASARLSHFLHEQSDDMNEVNNAVEEPLKASYQELSPYPSVKLFPLKPPTPEETCATVIRESLCTIYLFLLIGAVAHIFTPSMAALPPLLDVSSWKVVYVALAGYWIHSLSVCFHVQGELLDMLNMALVVVTMVNILKFGFQFLIPVIIDFFGGLSGREGYSRELTPVRLLALCLQSSTLFAFPCLVLLRQIYLSYVRENEISNKALGEERKNVQETVSDAIDSFADRRAHFLDTITSEIQTASNTSLALIEQLSPASLLVKVQEHLAACNIPIPTTSFSALNTSIKHTRYITTIYPIISELLYVQDLPTFAEDGQENTSGAHQVIRSTVREEFDIGDMVQGVGDLMSGIAGLLGVDLIVFHTENALYHMNVIADEGAIRHALVSLLRNILSGCTPGSCIEIGLTVDLGGERPIHDGKRRVSTGRALITINFLHTAPKDASDEGMMIPNANFTEKLLAFIGSSLKIEAVDDRTTSYTVTLHAEMGSDAEKSTVQTSGGHPGLRKRLSSIKFSEEPTVNQLEEFAVTLKGLRAVLYASDDSGFAKRLTQYLIHYGLDISHQPIDTQAAGISFNEQGLPHDITPAKENGNLDHPADDSVKVDGYAVAAHPQTEVSRPVGEPPLPSIIFIDDDIPTLEKKLTEYSEKAPVILHRRHRREKAQGQNSTCAIIHFTSLSNLKKVQSTIHWFLSIPFLQTFPAMQILVLPKPVGPRRLLTVMRTAMQKSVIQPEYLPIATSPSSPLLNTPGRSSHTPPTTPGGRPAKSADGDHSEGRKRDSIGHTSLYNSTSSNTYFPESAAALAEAMHNANTNASANAVTATEHVANNVQGSPTGVQTPEGIFFDPSPTRSQANQNTSPKDRISRHNSDAQLKRRSMGSMTESLAGIGTPHVPSGLVTERDVTESVAPQTEPTHATDDVPEPRRQALKEGTADSVTSVASPASEGTVTPTAANVDAQGKAARVNPSDSNGIAADANKQGSTIKQTSVAAARKRGVKKSSGTGATSGVVSPPINVLIVEDNIINQAILREWMKKHNIKCSVASDGRQAVEKWKQGGFHLVLMDIQLPVMDGIAATKEIRALEKAQKIGVFPSLSGSTPYHVRKERSATVGSSRSPSFRRKEDSVPNGEKAVTPPTPFRSPVIIVALTASSLDSDRHAALAAGCNDFLTKPVSLTWLERKITEWGCMQALIDFEGWRRWRKKSENSEKRKQLTAASEDKQVTTPPGLVASPVPMDTVKETPRKGILFPGAGSRRRVQSDAVKMTSD